MDFLLSAWAGGLIERSKVDWMFGKGKPWLPGERLKLLFAGYNGARNMGADVRVEEMLRQLRHILGADHVSFSVLSHNLEFSQGYFKDTAQLSVPDIFPPFLYKEIVKQHGVIACEGSTFKSKFANALTTMMIEALGIAAVQNKLSVGYGSEAGDMDPMVRKMCSRYCRDSLIITRNEESQIVLRKLSVPTELGTDTAWTFEPAPREFGQRVLREAGWDGQIPVLVVCPINPFAWPVKASVAKYALHRLTGAYKESHYRSLYFHNAGSRADRALDHYLTSIAKALDGFRKQRRVFIVLAATERLDRGPAKSISDKLGGVPIFSSDEYNMWEMVSILRSSHMMASSRYHGIVTSMPGLVPSAGITMDERIRNLMRERGDHDLLMNVDDPDLESRLLLALQKMAQEGEAIASNIGHTVTRNLKMMAQMGIRFEQEVQRCYPDFLTRKGEWYWDDYLPPMSADLLSLLRTYPT